MATYEKRGYIKEYDVTGKMISKVAIGQQAKELILEVEEEDFFEDE
jgi:hypothetical protein